MSHVWRRARRAVVALVIVCWTVVLLAAPTTDAFTYGAFDLDLNSASGGIWINDEGALDVFDNAVYAASGVEEAAYYSSAVRDFGDDQYSQAAIYVFDNTTYGCVK